jgi:TolB-like protein/DNA-binding SARP family transcriptional activator/Flp pilus assembly protein TadD
LLGPDDGTILGTHGHQRRRLALLAVLAAAGDAGRSRDQLLLLFWPDSTQARARHSLEQLLYSIRSSIDENVFSSVNPVRLNPLVVQSDLTEFESALEEKDLERAVDVYRGPFLDGFYLSESPEFEQWMDAERSRLERSYAGALERLAQTASTSGDHAAAVRWWRKLTETDAVSSRNATGLIRALMNAGDHAAALQYAERYEIVVAQELGTSVGPAIASLVAEVRAAAKSEPMAAGKAIHASAPQKAAPPPVPVASELPKSPLEVVSQSHPAPRPGTFYLIAAIVIVAVIGTAAWLRTIAATASTSAPAGQSIAVLPLVNLSGKPEDAAVVDGLSEELMSVLAKIPNLRVIARTSAFAFRNSEVSVTQIADSLHVSNVLEGSAQKSGSKLRVQVRLVDGRDGSTRWSETYDRELEDIFAVQSDIAGAVARELNLRLGDNNLARIARPSTPNIAAYELYLRGNDPTLMRNDSTVYLALQHFSDAVALDSPYAAAHAGLARMHMRLAFSGDTLMPRLSRIRLAEGEALKAVALDDALGEAHATLAAIRRYNLQLAAAEQEFKRAVDLDPTDGRIREWHAQFYVTIDRPDLALEEASVAVQLDPLSPSANAEVANALQAMGRCDEAFARLEKLKYLRPPLLRAGAIAAQCYAQKGMWPQAIAELQKISNSSARGRGLLGYMLGRAGRRGEAEAMLSGMLDRTHKQDTNAFDVAAVYAGLGERDQALTWLEKSVADRSMALEQLRMITTGMESDARLERLRLGLGLQKR